MPTYPLPFAPEAPWLAPLAGFSDLPFRLLCRELGAACAVTEMVSAKGLFYDSKNTKSLLATVPADAPLVVQLFGADPDLLARAVDELSRAGYVFFDLNCGCSVKKVVKTGAGAALLGTPERLVACARAMVRPQTHGSGITRVMSPVRNRIIGKASLVSVVMTSSPSSPSGSGSPVAGSMISMRK